VKKSSDKEWDTYVFSKEYHVAVGDNPTGPYSTDVLTTMAATGKITRKTLVWTKGMRQWAEAGVIDELSSIWSSAAVSRP
jgi:hypothetical protein